MREIKFRAWNKTLKQWFMGGATFDLQYSGRCGDFYFDNDHPCNMRQVDLEWVQFSGLLDRNGTEIYEGDVLNVPYNSIGNQKVKFLAGAFNCCGYNYRKCAVVGNVFENPELLP